MLDINRIYQGNCLELMQSIDDKSIDMILCDLPYGTTACKWDNVIPFNPLWDNYKRIIKDNGAIVLTASQPFTSMLVMSNLDWFKYEWIWEKSRGVGFINSKNAPIKFHENVLIFSNGATSNGNKNNMPYYPQGLSAIRKVKKNSERDSLSVVGVRPCRKTNTNYIQDFVGYPKSVLYFANISKTEHPTQKPVALFEYLIKTYTNENDLVLDNCIGSGTTAIACMQTNRNFIGMELEPKYVDIANKRIADFTKQLTMAGV